MNLLLKSNKKKCLQTLIVFESRPALEAIPPTVAGANANS